MSKYWNPLVQKLEPYTPGEQPKDQRYVKLNTNECPYPPAPEVFEAITEELDESLRLYPDPNGDILKQAVEDFYGLPSKYVFVSNSSDDVLAHVFHALFQSDTPVLFPDISYSFYPVYASLYQLKTEQIPLREDFSLVLEDYHKPNGGIIFPNPNAPTGLAVTAAQIEALVKVNTESVVVVDEAYVDFGAETVVPLLTQYPNLLVVQTLSKSRSLAGLRVGFAMGHPDLIEALERVKNSFNSYPLGRMELAGAAAALKDRTHFKANCAKIMSTREQVTKNLQRLGFTVLPSSANFVFAAPAQGNAEELYLALKQRGVLVRFFKKPRLERFLRITIGTDRDMAILLDHLFELVG